MSKRKKYHVTKTDTGWSVKAEGANRASANLDTKQEAIQRGKKLAKSADSGQLIIHKQDGEIQTEYTYGNDPYPPKG